MKTIQLLEFLSLNSLNFQKDENLKIFCFEKSTDSEIIFLSILKKYLKDDFLEIKSQQELFFKVKLELGEQPNKIYWIEDNGGFDSLYSVLQARNISSDAVVFCIFDKIKTKDEKELNELSAIKIEFPKLFSCKDFAIQFCKILTKPFKNLFFKEFEALKFENLAQILTLIDLSLVVSDKNIFLFKEEFCKLEKNNAFYILPRLLFQESIGAAGPTKFFQAWVEIKDNFPIQFWTIFFMNKVWTLISEENTKNVSRLKTLFNDLYKADLMSKTINSQIYLEPIFYQFMKK